MMRRRLCMVASVFVVMLTLPRIAHAGIGELIWEMSGPQMIGGGLECKFSPTTGKLEISYATLPVPLLTPEAPRRFRISLDGGIYTSTGKNAGDVDYQAFKTWMLAFDPMIEVVSYDNGVQGKGRRELYHGVMGVSYNYLFGSGFAPFTNVALKLRPIGYGFGRFNVEFDLRMYPNGFSAGDFGKVAPEPESNRAETTWGVSMGIAFGKFD